MAKVFEINEEMRDWIESRPDGVKDIIGKHPPNLLYHYIPGNQRVTIHSYSEGGTVTISITGQYNLISFSRQVFGINPEDLEECELPPEDEVLGEIMNEKEATDFITSRRASTE